MSSGFESKYIWHNGELVPWQEAKVHVMTNGLHYGTGVFEGIRAYWNGSQLYVFRLKDHLTRFMNSVKIYGYGIDYTIEELRKAVVDTLRANELRTDVYIRPIAFKGYGPIGLDVRKLKTEVFIIAMPYGRYFEKEGISVIVSSWRRISKASLPVTAKATGHYANSVLAKLEALTRGYDDAILLNEEGHVCEGTGENIMMAKSGVVYTPPISDGILDGITRRTIIELSGEIGIEVREQSIERSQLYSADELFFVGTAAEVTPILKVDDRPIGDGRVGPIARKIKDYYQRVARGEIKEHLDWLEPVW